MPHEPMLASDADRDRSVELLRAAVGEGRLTLEEFTERETAPVRDAPRLRIHVSGPGGTLYVRNRPPAGTLEKLLGTARNVRGLSRGDNERHDS